MAFPQTPLDVRTDLQIGGVWTDVSADTYLRSPITINAGRADEASKPDHSTATITFNNRLGRYSPRNQTGPYYGQIGRNSPIRVSVPAGANYLRLTGDPAARASTPDATALDVLGDLDVRVDATLENWHTGHYVDLIGKWGAPGAFSWRLSLSPTGGLYLAWSPDGGATTPFAGPAVALPVPPSGRLAVRVTLDVNNGSGGRTVSFYCAPSGTSGPWTFLSDLTLAGTTSIFNSTAGLEVGDITGTTASVPPVGRIHAVEVRNGINGTVVANPVFSAQSAGTTSFTDAAGRTWGLSGGAEISDRDYRFHGEVSSWPGKWDVSGRDRYVPVEAAGPLRRYGAGSDPLHSTLFRRIPSDPSVTGYWPMEDGPTATQAYSPMPGVAPMQLTGVQFAADDSLPGSAALPTLSDKAFMSAYPTPTAAATGEWRTEFVYRIDTAPTTPAVLVKVAGTGTVRTWAFSYQSGTVTVQGYDAGDTAVVNAAVTIGSDVFGHWARQEFYLTASGGTVTWTIQWTVVGGTGGASSGTYSGTVGTVSRVFSPFDAQLSGARIGHLAVFNGAQTAIFDQADTGFDGEQAHVRIDRLCAEESIPVVFPAGAGPTAAMGPQRPMALLDLLEECADADMGILFESRSFGRLAFRRHSSLYNQPAALALDYARDGDVSPPLEPVDDDTAARNRITVSRTGGSSATADLKTGPLSVLPPPNGIGPVTGGGTVNVTSDDQLPDIAGWQLHLGTYDGSRYPSVHVDLAAGPGLIPAARAVQVGDRITIAHPPPECGVGDLLDLLAQGYTETLGILDWDLVFNCTPGGPWLVGVLDDPVLGRADTDGSQLAAGITATATTFQVQVTAGPLWITTANNASDFPVSVRVGGEVMSVGAISGTTSPQTFSSVTRSVNGVVKAQSAGADVRLDQPMILAL